MGQPSAQLQFSSSVKLVWLCIQSTYIYWSTGLTVGARSLKQLPLLHQPEPPSTISLLELQAREGVRKLWCPTGLDLWQHALCLAAFFPRLTSRPAQF